MMGDGGWGMGDGGGCIYVVGVDCSYLVTGRMGLMGIVGGDGDTQRGVLEVGVVGAYVIRYVVHESLWLDAVSCTAPCEKSESLQ